MVQLGFDEVYLAIVVLFGKDLSCHEEHIRRVVDIVAEYEMERNISKCEYEKSNVSMLGGLVDK